MLQEDQGWEAICAAGRWLTLQHQARIKLDAAARAETSRRAAALDRSTLHGALSHLAGVQGEQGEDQGPAGRAQLAGALALVCEALGHEHGEFPRPRAEADPASALRVLVRQARLRQRPVALKGRWWTGSYGPLVGFRLSEDCEAQAVALLPGREGGYVLVEPGSEARLALTEGEAQAIAPIAHQIYRPLPTASVSFLQLWVFGKTGVGADIFTIAGIGMLLGMVGVVPPLAAGQVYDRVIPEASYSLLIQVGFALVMVALGTFTFELGRRVAVLRVQNHIEDSLQHALWSRLLDLPPPFFRDYTAGDLAIRAQGLGTIRQVMSVAASTSIMGGIFSAWYLLVLIWISPLLTAWALGLTLVALAVAAGTFFLKFRHQQELAELEGELGGTLLQLLSGISKLRVAGTEQRAFARWAELFARREAARLRASDLDKVSNSFGAGFPVLVSACVFWVVAGGGGTQLSTGQFLAFAGALGSFTAAMLGLTGAVVSVIGVLPLYQRFVPILTAETECSQDRELPGDLSGELEVSRVSFRYGPKLPLVLRDVSVRIQPGEFVALVGPSGSGKSTLFRMLLGFEIPESGVVFYDQRDLGSLDLREVRSQLGVVLQDSELRVGSIFENIAGTTGCSPAQAWEAAQKVGLAAEIQAMPMGMHTVLSQGGGGLSGGQRQRLFLARALINKPRVLFLDEATSALDNRSQALVTAALDKQRVTRIVIAHRLSTIRGADRILVLDGGRIVEQGPYQELMELDGVFAAMASRQLVEQPPADSAAVSAVHAS